MSRAPARTARSCATTRTSSLRAASLLAALWAPLPVRYAAAAAEAGRPHRAPRLTCFPLPAAWVTNSHSVHLHPRRILPRGLQPPAGHPRGLQGYGVFWLAAASGPPPINLASEEARWAVVQHSRLPWKGRLRFGLQLRRLRPPRCGCLHLRRGDRPHREHRGQARQAPPEAAVPGRRRPVRLPDHRRQRRDGRRGAHDLPAVRAAIGAQPRRPTMPLERTHHRAPAPSAPSPLIQRRRMVRRLWP